MITLDEDYDLKGTIVTIENDEATRTLPRATQLVAVQVNPPMMVQTYQQRPITTVRDEWDLEYKTVLWTY